MTNSLSGCLQKVHNRSVRRLQPSFTRPVCVRSSTRKNSNSKTQELNMSRTQDKAAAALAEAHELPELVVFDLDYTLWPFWCEMYTTRDQPKLFPEARSVLEALKDKGVAMALASRTPTPEVARAFLKKLDLASGMFVSQQLIPAANGFDHNSAQKDVRHFPAIQVSKLGVTSVLVSTREGVSVKTLREGLEAYSKQTR